MFAVPEFGPPYVKRVVRRCDALIRYSIWSGLPRHRLSGWMNNFKTPEEEYFAACVLDSLIFRSAPQTEALVRHLLQRVIPDLFRVEAPPPGFPIGDWSQRIKRHASLGDPGLRFVPAIRRTDDPAKSGGYVAGLIERAFNVDADRWIVSPWNLQRHIDNGVPAFIFFDDFLGTGSQFRDVIDAEGLADLIRERYVGYTPLVAHTRGIQSLKDRYPGLHISPVETLAEENQLFHPAAMVFDDEINTSEEARDFYLELLARHGLNVDADTTFGFGNLELAFAFEHSIPDNSLPILWWARAGQWSPLLPR